MLRNPLLQALLDVDFQGCRPEIPAAHVACQSKWLVKAVTWPHTDWDHSSINDWLHTHIQHQSRHASYTPSGMAAKDRFRVLPPPASFTAEQPRMCAASFSGLNERPHTHFGWLSSNRASASALYASTALHGQEGWGQALCGQGCGCTQRHTPHHHRTQGTPPS